MEHYEQRMGRTRLESGFTLVEALVAMVIFTVGFSGLFFFYSLSQQTITDSSRRLGINLIANRIIDTVAAEAQRPLADSKNPFVTPSMYSADLRSCNYNANDVRQAWCSDLNTLVGAYNPASGKESRLVTVVNDGTGVIVDIVIITSDGTVSAYFSRKIRQLL